MRQILLPLPLLFVTTLPAIAADAEQIAAGKELYRNHCPDCHGKDAKGVDGAGSDIREAIVRQVVMATGGGYEEMPEVVLTDEEIEAIVAYLNSL